MEYACLNAFNEMTHHELNLQLNYLVLVKNIETFEVHFWLHRKTANSQRCNLKRSFDSDRVHSGGIILLV